MKQNKPWSLTEVAKAHDYFLESNQNDSVPHHEIFAGFLKTKKNPKVLDIGCGNVRVLNSISHYSKYLGVDLCEDLITSCNKKFKDNTKVSFLAMDIESDDWPKEIKEYDVAYLDSTFTMMENPDLLFKRLIKSFKTIFFNRTRIYQNNDNIEMIKTNHRWAGMKETSPLWMFGPQYFINFCDSYGGECAAYSEDIVIYEQNKKFEKFLKV